MLHIYFLLLFLNSSIDFFDDLASGQDTDLPQNTAVDISVKNLHMLGVKIYCDEFRSELRTVSRDVLASEKSLLVRSSLVNYF